MANVTFTGNVANPDLKFANGSGKAYFTFSVAEKHRRKNRDTGQYEDAGTTWRRVTYFGNALFTAEALAEQVVKGAHVIVHGDEQTEEYQKNDGTPGSSVVVIPEPGNVGVIPKAARGQDQPAYGAQQARGGSQGGFGSPGVSGGFGGRESAAQGFGFGQTEEAPF